MLCGIWGEIIFIDSGAVLGMLIIQFGKYYPHFIDEKAEILTIIKQLRRELNLNRELIVKLLLKECSIVCRLEIPGPWNTPLASPTPQKR